MDTFMCFSLENAGWINSWFLLCFLTVIETIIGYSFWWNVHQCNSYKASGCYEIISMTIMVSIAIVLFAWIIMCWLCIKGIKRRNHKLIKPLMIWEEILCVSAAFASYSEPIYGCSCLVVNVYIFIILKSLYLKFKDENEPPQTLHLTIV